MSSNNLDEKPLYNYIAKCLQNWGMHYITQQTIKKCKKNEDQAITPMARLLFDLSLLHIFDYQYLPQELNISFGEGETEMMEIILAHLYECQCPLVIVRQQEEKTTVGFDFTSSKNLLIACGWLMAVSNFFSNVVSKLFTKRLNAIYKPKPLNFTALSQKYTNVIKNINYHENADQLTRISYLAKTLKSRKYSVECLLQKKSKILGRLKKELKNIDASLNLEDVLSSGGNQQIQALEAELKECLIFQKENMGFRKYWWIWLDQKIIESQYKELKQKDYFQKLQANPESIMYSVKIDLNFVGNYLESLDSAESKIETIGNKIESLQIKGDKVFKDIEKDILRQLKAGVQHKQIREEVPSFIGMQLKNYLGLQQKSVQIPKQEKKKGNKAIEKSRKKLAEDLRSFISQIDAIVLI